MYRHGIPAHTAQVHCRRRHHCRCDRIAQQVNPKYGGILAAAPIITTLAFLFTYSDAGMSTTRQLVLGTFFFAIPTLVFLLALYLLMNRLGFLESLGGAYGVWLVCVVIMGRFVAGM